MLTREMRIQFKFVSRVVKVVNCEISNIDFTLYIYIYIYKILYKKKLLSLCNNHYI